MLESDRRTPRVTVQQLRRDLREADEDRYRLATSGRARTVPSTPRTVGLLILLACAFGSAFWTMWAPAMTADQTASVSVVAPVPAAEPTDPPAPTMIEEQRPATSPRSKARSRSRSARPPRPAVERHAPRPLHPGEFGRDGHAE